MEHVEIGVDGMKLDVNPHGGNGLRYAMNVVFRKPGVAEPRPGFGFTSGVVMAGDRVVKILPAGGDATDIVTVDDDDPVTYNIGAIAGPAWANFTMAGGDDLFFASPASVFSAEARGNQYYSVYAGVLNSASGIRARVHGATTLNLAGYPGLPPRVRVARTGGSTPPAVEAGNAVAYRSTLENKLGEVSRVSVPSERTDFVSQGADADVTVTIYLPAQAVAGDIARIFRSTAVTSAGDVFASDQMFLLYTRELSSSDISAGSFTYADSTPDDALGEALYTNPERGGVLASNYRPPACKTIEEFQGSVLFGNAAQPHRLLITMPMYGARTGQAAGIGPRAATGTITGLGSAAVTGVTTTGLKIGMLLDDRTGWTGSGPVRITNIVGTTLTLSHTYAGASTAATGSWHDSIRISCADGSGEDRYFPVHLIASPGAYFLHEMLTQYVAVSDATIGTTRMSCATAYEVGYNHYVSPIQVSISLAKVQPGGAALEVWATHGSEYDPPLPEPTVTDGLESTADVWEDAVYWSRRNEPEHVPLLNYARVGRLGSPILRMLRGQDCVWIFKADGVFRMSGFGERSGFRFDPIYPDLVIRAPGCADQMSGMVYAYTNSGAVAFSSGGDLRYLSDSITGYLRAYDDETGVANEGALCFVTCNPSTHEVMFGLGLGDDDDDGVAVSRVFVYSERAKAWSVWGGDGDGDYDGSGFFSDHMSCCAIYHDGRVFFGEGLSAVAVWYERTDDGSAGADYEIALATLATLDGIVYTHAGASDPFLQSYDVKVGDVVLLGSAPGTHRIIVDVSAGTFTVNKAMGSLLVPVVQSAFVSALQWNARGAGHPGTAKQWSAGSVLFGQFSGVCEWTWRNRSDRTADAVNDIPMSEAYEFATAVTTLNSDSPVPAQTRRTWTPREAARCAVLFPEFVICQGHSRWQVYGIAITAKPLSTRVATRVTA